MFNFLTVNTNGIRDADKRAAFMQWLNCYKPDLVCLQETHVLSCAEGLDWFAQLGLRAVSSPGTTRSCGTILLYRPMFDLLNTWTDSNSRFAMAKFKRNEVTFRVTVYMRLTEIQIVMVFFLRRRYDRPFRSDLFRR